MVGMKAELEATSIPPQKELKMEVSWKMRTFGEEIALLPTVDAQPLSTFP